MPEAVGGGGSWISYITNDIFIFICRSHFWRRDLSSGSLGRQRAGSGEQVWNGVLPGT